MQNLHQIVELREAFDNNSPATPSKKPHIVTESPSSPNNTPLYPLKRVSANTTHTRGNTSREDTTPCYGIHRVTSQSNSRPSGSPPLPARLPLDLDKLKSDSNVFEKISPPKSKMFDIGWNRTKARARATGVSADKDKSDNGQGCCSPDTKEACKDAKGPWADHKIDGSDLKMDWEDRTPAATKRSTITKGSNRLKRSKRSKGGESTVFEENMDGKIEEATKDGKTPECDRKMTFDKIVPDDKMGNLTDEEENGGPKKKGSGAMGELFKKVAKGLGKVKVMLSKKKADRVE